MFKKVFLAALALIGSVSLANAQEVFHKGTTAINAGIGLGSYYSGITIPPLSVSLDYGVADNLINGNNGSISVGGFAGYTASSHTYGTYKSTFSYIALVQDAAQCASLSEEIRKLALTEAADRIVDEAERLVAFAPKR